MKGSSDRSSHYNAMEQSNAILEENERRRRDALTPEQRAEEDKANREREEQDKKDSERNGKILVIVIACFFGLMFLGWLYEKYVAHVKPRLHSRRIGVADGGGGYKNR